MRIILGNPCTFELQKAESSDLILDITETMTNMATSHQPSRCQQSRTGYEREGQVPVTVPSLPDVALPIPAFPDAFARPILEQIAIRGGTLQMSVWLVLTA